MTTNSIPTTPLPNRREFLYYLAGGALLLGVGGGVALTQRFLQEQPREGIDILTINLEEVPRMGAAPYIPFADMGLALTVLSHVNHGLVALSRLCPHEGCVLRWDHPEYRFKCPCSGSQFELDGTLMAGPARRNMDQYVLMAQTARGSIETPPDGAPLPLEGVRTLTVDLRRVIYGAVRGS
jgi:nitrite reductase/ring-hydroxylating ferredoxin subunit